MVSDHLSWSPNLKAEELPFNDSFPNDKLFVLVIKDTPWYADFVNYLDVEVLPLDLNYERRKKFFSNMKHYY